MTPPRVAPSQARAGRSVERTCVDLRPKLAPREELPPALAAAELLAGHLRRLVEAYASVFELTDPVGPRFTVTFRPSGESASLCFGLWLRECGRQGRLASLVAAYLEEQGGVLVQVLDPPADAIGLSVSAETSCADVERFVGALEPALDALRHWRSDLLFRGVAGAPGSFAAPGEPEDDGVAVDEGACDATLRVLYEPPDLPALARLDASLLTYNDRAAAAVGRWIADKLSPFSLERRSVRVGARRLLVEHVCFPTPPEARRRRELERSVEAARGVALDRGARLALCQAAARRLAIHDGDAEAVHTAAAVAKALLCGAMEQIILPELEGSEVALRFVGADAATERELRERWARGLSIAGGSPRAQVEVVLVFPDASAAEVVPHPSSVVLDVFGVLRWRPSPATLQANVLYIRGATLQVLGSPLPSVGPGRQESIDVEVFGALLELAVGASHAAASVDPPAPGSGLRVVALRGFWGNVLPAEWRAFRQRCEHPGCDLAPSEVTILNPPLVPREAEPINVCEQIFSAAHLASSSTLVAPGTGEVVSYAELRLRAIRCAERFRQLGLRRGDAVALAAPDGIASVAVLLGCLMGGWACAPLNFHSEANLLAMLEAARPKLVLYDPSCAPSLAAFREAPVSSVDSIVAPRDIEPEPSGFSPVRVSPSSAAVILFTSGSTGTPKAVAHSHHDLLECSRNYATYVLGLTPADRVHTPSPMFFAYGIHNLMLALLAGATHVVAAPRASGVPLIDVLAKYEVTVLLSVPAVYKLLLSKVDRAPRIPRLRLCVSAGERLPPRLFRELRDLFGVEPLDGIGCTEALSTFISNCPGYVAAGCTGVVVPGFAVKLVNELGELCDIGEVGTLWLRGAALAEAYMTDPELTSATFRDGWFQTRDMFYYDAEYRFYNVGRAASTLKINACWFSAENVEAVLQTHPAVKECVVGFVDDGYQLPRPKAFVVVDAESGYDQDLERLWSELRALSKQKLGKDQYPHLFARINAVPRTASGKLIRSHPSLTQQRGAGVEPAQQASGERVMSWT